MNKQTTGGHDKTKQTAQTTSKNNKTHNGDKIRRNKNKDTTGKHSNTRTYQRNQKQITKPVTMLNNSD